jgi:hypothetical protein
MPRVDAIVGRGGQAEPEGVLEDETLLAKGFTDAHDDFRIDSGCS